MEISENEQESVQKAALWDLEPLDGKVYMEVSVFHNLHCLDLVRRALEPDHYDVHTDFTSQLDPQWKRVHICELFWSSWIWRRLTESSRPLHRPASTSNPVSERPHTSTSLLGGGTTEEVLCDA